MSTITEQYSPHTRAKVQRTRTPGGSRPRVADSQSPGMTPIMGPANRAPGVPIMGVASAGPYLMGGADAGPRVSVMGRGDRGRRVDVFGDSDLSFVDSLFHLAVRSGQSALGAAQRPGRGPAG